MKVFTLTCEACGTVIAGNVVEQYRRMKCPRLECENVISFDDLPPEQRRHLVENRERHRMD